MNTKKIFCSIIAILILTSSCGPRRYKCGPYRKCENSIEKNENNSFNKEYHKSNLC